MEQAKKHTNSLITAIKLKASSFLWGACPENHKTRAARIHDHSNMQKSVIRTSEFQHQQLLDWKNVYISSVHAANRGHKICEIFANELSNERSKQKVINVQVSRVNKYNFCKKAYLWKSTRFVRTKFSNPSIKCAKGWGEFPFKPWTFPILKLKLKQHN